MKEQTVLINWLFLSVVTYVPQLLALNDVTNNNNNHNVQQCIDL